MRTFKYLIIRPQGAPEPGEILLKEPGTESNYDTLKNLVEPIVDGPLEHIGVLHPTTKKPASMFGDEMAHVRNDRLDPINVEATRIYQAYAHSRGEENTHEIRGTVILFDEFLWR